VSALGNVISLDLRTSIPVDSPDQLNSLNYVKMLNSVLPNDIRIMA